MLQIIVSNVIFYLLSLGLFWGFTRMSKKAPTVTMCVIASIFITLAFNLHYFIEIPGVIEKFIAATISYFMFTSYGKFGMLNASIFSPLHTFIVFFGTEKIIEFIF